MIDKNALHDDLEHYISTDKYWKDVELQHNINSVYSEGAIGLTEIVCGFLKSHHHAIPIGKRYWELVDQLKDGLQKFVEENHENILKESNSKEGGTE